MIIGCVFTSNVIAQRLTDYMWLGNSRVIDDAAAIRLARVLYSLRLASDDLRDYYLNLSPHTDTAKKLRFFPSITSYRAGTRTVNFQYQRPLQSVKACVTFLAVEIPPAIEISMDSVHGRADGQRIVVKFVRRYGDEAHRLLASKGLAPELLYCGPISEDPSLWHGERCMVVMEYIEGKAAPMTVSVRKRIMKAVEFLHEGSMVHGDLRKPNIMIQDGEGSEPSRTKIIDFDWAGREGEVRYPVHLSDAVRWPEGVQDYEFITHEHDKEMVEQVWV